LENPGGMIIVPVVQDAGEKVGIAAARHGVKEVSLENLTAGRKPRGLEARPCAADGLRQVEYDPLRARVRAQYRSD
jgi:hypothetical protein